MRSSRLIATAIALALTLVPTAIAQSTGPDVFVAALPNVSNYAAVGGTDAISVGTTSCNQGDTPLLWQSSNPNHPVIGQNLYRVWEGRFDMIGRSWLKHGFTTVNNGICGSCSGPTGAQLYPGCSDPYSSGLNGSQGGLGPRFEVNADTGAFLYPYTDQGVTGNSIFKRLQYSLADVDPANYPGARYFVEGHYVAPDDAAAGNQNNNASYREVAFSVTGADSTASFVGGTTTVQQVPAIGAWPLVDPNVAVQVVDIPNEGRLLVGFRATPQPSGLVRYVYAVHNLNSHRSVRLVNVAMPTGASVSNLTFNAPLWHSGEPYANTAWPGAYVGNAVEWSTDTEAVDPNANAIRWGTTHTFSFDSNLAPTGTVSFGLFRARGRRRPSRRASRRPPRRPSCSPCRWARRTRCSRCRPPTSTSRRLRSRTAMTRRRPCSTSRSTGRATRARRSPTWAGISTAWRSRRWPATRPSTGT
ncbi:MAG: hypothetical protein R3F20_19040 [Planctomycetota bacterium]